jgi:hypothetical protein
MKSKAVWMAVAALLAAAPAGAQVVSGSVQNARTSRPVEYASVIVSNAEGVIVASTQADGGGRFTVHLPAGGQYVLRIEEPGFHALGARFTVGQGRSFSRSFRMSELAWTASAEAERDPIGKRGGRPVDEGRGNVPRLGTPTGNPR